MRIRKLYTFFILLCLLPLLSTSQDNPYWNRNTHLIPWRFPIPGPENIERLDRDGNRKPDVIRGILLPDSIPYMWIDQDGSMTRESIEGSTVNGLLLVDRNRDGYFDGPRDLIVKWGDRNNNRIPDVMMVIQNGGPNMHHYFDWGADYMIVIDEEEQGILNYIDWNQLLLQCWEHDGHAGFYTDYHGNTMFLKMHGSSYRMNDLRCNWENPFIFFSEDNDPYSEWTIRLVDEPLFRKKEGNDPRFEGLNEEIDIKFSQRISDVRMSWDMDNDNVPGSEFDFDMSIKLTGPGFDYSDQIHPFEVLKCDISMFPDTFWVDSRWSNLEELIFPGREDAWNLLWERGKWKQAQFTFDEDDDCHRWERVELYDPRDPFISGTEKGGIDHNKQADVAGDRGNWDLDFSGEGNLYIGNFDAKIHLFGAETGVWRIDQTAFYYQGFGGNYGRWGRERLQPHAEKFATVKYSDTDNNGFFDRIEYDLDGDRQFEEQISLSALGIEDTCRIIQTSQLEYTGFRQLFAEAAEKSFGRAKQMAKTAEALGLDTHWYSYYKNPTSTFQRYQFGFWMGFYLYRDLREYLKHTGRSHLLRKLDVAYYSGNWTIFENQFINNK
jgi:hypothetical protein